MSRSAHRGVSQFEMLNPSALKNADLPLARGLTGDRRKSRTFSADTMARSAPGDFTRQSYTNRARTVKSHIAHNPRRLLVRIISSLSSHFRSELDLAVASQ